MSGPLISVVIPTRHRNDLLARCLERLAPSGQTLPAEQYEVIVTDDGSDSTAEAMIVERFPWARWTRGPRKGPAANRNHGASLARGQFLAFTDDDCVPDPQWLAGFAAAIVDDVHVYEGRTTCRAGVHSPRWQAPVNETGGWLWSCNMLVRRSFFEHFHFDEGFPFPHMEDVYLRERLKQEHQRFVFVPAATVDHPPRPIPSGHKWAATHECEVIFRYKMHQPPLTRGQYLWHLAKLRLKAIARHRVGLDSLRALYHSTVEWVIVAGRYNRWMRTHRPL